MIYLWYPKYSAGGSQVVTFAHWAEQQWILNLLLFPQLLWQDKICINFCCTSCTYKNLSNSMPSSSRVPVSWCSIAIGIAANPLFFQVLRSKDQRLCNEKPTKLDIHLFSKHQGQLFPIFTATTITMIFMVFTSQVFKFCKLSRNALALSQAVSTDIETIIDFSNELLSLEVRW